MTQAPSMRTAVEPTWTWGSSARIRMTSTGSTSIQIAQVSLPEPAVCSLYFQASMTARYPVDLVRVLTINMNQGLGRVTVPRQLSFVGQPALGAPLEFTEPFVPLHALNVDASAVPDFFSVDPDPFIEIEIYLVLSPLTRIPQKEQKLAFGMGLPGEADDLDDELRGELEAEGPTVQDMMHRMHGEEAPNEPDDDDDDDDDEQVQRAPAWLLTLVDRMTERLGRKPSRFELAQAVRRLRARQARRRERTP